MIQNKIKTSKVQKGQFQDSFSICFVLLLSKKSNEASGFVNSRLTKKNGSRRHDS